MGVRGALRVLSMLRVLVISKFEGIGLNSS